MNFANMWSLAPEPLDDATAERMGALIERLASETVRRRLAAPVVLALESTKPLSFLGSQALVFLEPLVRTFLNPADYDLFIRLLEDRSQVERLLEAIDTREDARLFGSDGGRLSGSDSGRLPGDTCEDARLRGPNGTGP